MYTVSIQSGARAKRREVLQIHSVLPRRRTAGYERRSVPHPSSAAPECSIKGMRRAAQLQRQGNSGANPQVI